MDEKNSGRSYDRISGNAANIGFAASVDTGMNGIHVNLQCESWTLHNNWHGNGGWCTRNSKIGLSHPQMGEIMFATWLLPYNEAVAQWIDPFYDAGSDSHTSIMGGTGAFTGYHSPGYFGNRRNTDGEEHPAYADGYDNSFNRRQEEIIQYFSPNWNGFKFRFAWTAGFEDEIETINGRKADPVIRSASIVYENGPLWLATTWQDHEDWAATRHGTKGEMEASDAESIRLAGRYIMDLGDGMSISLAAMWEDLEYEFNGVTDVDSAMAAFGYSNFGSYDLLSDAGEVIGATAASGSAPTQIEPTEDQIKAQKTLELVQSLFYEVATGATDHTLISGVQGDQWSGVTSLLTAALQPTTETDDPLTAVDESDVGCASTDPATCTDLSQNVSNLAALETAVMALNNARDTVTDDANDPATVGIQAPNLEVAVGQPGAGTVEQRNAQVQYDLLVSMATAAAEEAVGMTPDTRMEAKTAAENRAGVGAGGNVKIERDAWMVSGKIKFGGPIDFRFSYMDADDLEVSCANCSGDWNETAADAWNVGLFYTMPAGTELRLTYSEVNNDDQGTYGQGVSWTGIGSPGNEIEMFAVGIVHWFD